MYCRQEKNYPGQRIAGPVSRAEDRALRNCLARIDQPIYRSLRNDLFRLRRNAPSKVSALR